MSIMELEEKVAGFEQRIKHLEAIIGLSSRHPIVTRSTAVDVVRHVCEFLGVKEHDVFSRDRRDCVAWARHVSMYILRETQSFTLPAIGQIFDRDHSCVFYALSHVESRTSVDKKAKAQLDHLLSVLPGQQMNFSQTLNSKQPNGKEVNGS